MASLSYQANNTAAAANQFREIGMFLTPDMGSIDPNTLEKAIPMFSDTLRVDTSAQQDAVDYCRTYAGMDGLRKLQADQATNTVYDPGCGWMFQQSSGATNPQITEASSQPTKAFPSWEEQARVMYLQEQDSLKWIFKRPNKELPTPWQTPSAIIVLI